MSARTRASSPGGVSIQSGTLAARPAAGVADRYYWATDILTMFRDTGVAWEVVGAQYYNRMIWSFLTREAPGASAVITVNRVYLAPVIIKRTCTVDRVGYIQGAAVAGNVVAGIYYDNGDTPVGANILVNGVSQAVAVGTLIKKEVTIPNTRLTPGLYWLAIMFDDAINALCPFSGYAVYGGSWTTHRYEGAAFPAFTTPCPATFSDIGIRPCYVRVTSVP